MFDSSYNTFLLDDVVFFPLGYWKKTTLWEIDEGIFAAFQLFLLIFLDVELSQFLSESLLPEVLR